jgi:hypothetical protein
MRLVTTSCLERLQPRDFEFIAATLGGGEAALDFLEQIADEPETLASFLEVEGLFRRVMELPSPLAISPELYFFVLVRRSLRDCGIDDLAVADYVAATLAEQAGGPLSGGGGGTVAETQFTYHVEFFERIAEASPTERFFLEVQCGNRFLVLTGLFPRFLERRSERRGAPGLSYYEGVARHSFLAAGRHPLAAEYDLRGVYARLADCFTETRVALNRMAEHRLFLGA